MSAILWVCSMSMTPEEALLNLRRAFNVFKEQWRIQDFPNGGRCFVTNGGAHILFSGKKCMKLKEIGLKWGGARLLAPCYSKITIFL